jgi:hypothetical protein
LTGEGITFFIVNLVPFLNLALGRLRARVRRGAVHLPGVSLEGRTWWLLRASPLPVRELLWSKFWVGMVPLLVLALGIVGVTNSLLHVSVFMFAVSVFTITLMTFALAGLAIGFGTMFPRFETENARADPTSFGGLLYMMSAVGVIGAVIVLEGAPGVQLRIRHLVPRRRTTADDGARAWIRARRGRMPNGDVLADPNRHSATGGARTLGHRHPGYAASELPQFAQNLDAGWSIGASQCTQAPLRYLPHDEQKAGSGSGAVRTSRRLGASTGSATRPPRRDRRRPHRRARQAPRHRRRSRRT